MLQEKKILNTITRANIVKKFEHIIFTDDKLLKFFQLSSLLDFETTLSEVFHDFYNNIVKFYVNFVIVKIIFALVKTIFALANGHFALAKIL
jgi:hypothetical protein